ncbi:MAG: alpha/beta hydrolase domain-containing protein [Burkholderiaceae bacterium]
MARFKHVMGAALCTAMLTLTPTAAHARVTALEILEQQNPSFEGASFAAAGTYRRIVARAHFAVDPSAPANAAIVDIDKAPRNAAGEVEFSSDLVILQPSDPQRGNHRLFYEVSNRGRNLSFPLLNDGPYAPDPSTAKQAGNGFLLNAGYTVVWSGWQPDLPGKLVDLTVPVAAGVTGMSREEFIFDADGATGKGPLTYPASDLDPGKATLTVRVNEQDERRTVDGLAFRYVNDREIEISRPAGLPAGAIYEFIYPAKDSLVTGLGFAAVRDLVSWLRGAPGHDVPPPVARIDHTIGLGISQAGRLLRDFIYQGFNADETGRQVFDGAMAHIAGSRKTFTNYRFAQPGRYSRQHEDHAYPGDQFPFTYGETFDPLTQRSDGILKQCRANATCPKIIHTDTDTEFWQARASLVATDPAGQPTTIPDDVRLYYLAGTQHYTIAGAPIKADKACAFDNNYFHVGAVMRGLVHALDQWITDGTLPPASRFPNRVGATLVKPAELALPAIPGLEYQAKLNRLQVMDHSVMPPAQGAEYPVYVANVDNTGNAIDGVRLPRIAVPLATHAGWNLRKAGFAKGELCSLSGSYVPLAKDPAGKQAGDGRPAISELYRNEAQYMAAVEAQIASLTAQRLVLAGDGEMLRERARAHWQRLVQ